jgi:hypothetical protein
MNAEFLKDGVDVCRYTSSVWNCLLYVHWDQGYHPSSLFSEVSICSLITNLTTAGTVIGHRRDNEVYFECLLQIMFHIREWEVQQKENEKLKVPRSKSVD